MIKYILNKFLLCTSCVLFLSIPTIFASDIEEPIAVKITDLRITGIPKTGNTITLEIDYISAIDGIVELDINQPEYLTLTGNTSLLKTTINALNGRKNTAQLQFLVNDKGYSLINIIVSCPNAPKGYIKRSCESISIEQRDSNNYAIFSFLNNDFLLKTATYTQKLEIKPLQLNTKSATTKTFEISGWAQYLDSIESWKGVYGSKIHLMYADATGQSIKYVASTIIAPDGSFKFIFQDSYDFSKVHYLTFFLEASNKYVILNSKDILTINDILAINVEKGKLPFSTEDFESHVFISSLVLIVNTKAGEMLRNFMFAGEFLEKRYNHTLPKIRVNYKDPFISTNIDKILGLNEAAGLFCYVNTEPFIYIKTNATSKLSTIAHEYGHYINHRMWGFTSGISLLDQILDPILNIYRNIYMGLASTQLTEGWAIFYSFAVRNYVDKVYPNEFIIAIDGVKNNLEESPFYVTGGNMRRFRGISYDQTHPEYSAFGCYLWNLYDGYDDDIFKSNKYNGDNDDISGYWKRVYNIMQKRPSSVESFHNDFKIGLPSAVQNSVDRIYDYMLINENTLMHPAQVKNISLNLLDNNSIMFNWEKNTYKTTSFYNGSDYKNEEEGYKLYGRIENNEEWRLLATIPNQNNSYILNLSNAFQYQYYLTSYNSSGNSCGEEIVFPPKCNSLYNNFLSINNVIYTDNRTIEACNINMKNTSITNNSFVTLNANFDAIIEDQFEVNLGSSLVINSIIPRYQEMIDLTPKNLQLYSKSSTSLTIEWDFPINNEDIKSYEVINDGITTETTSLMRHTLTNLEPCSSYLIKVRTIDKYDNYSPYISINAETMFVNYPPSTTLSNIINLANHNSFIYEVRRTSSISLKNGFHVKGIEGKIFNARITKNGCEQYIY